MKAFHFNKEAGLAKRIAAAGVVGALTLSLLAGCGSTESADSDKDAEDGVTTVQVGVATNFEDVSYLNEDGELEGYEIDLLNAIDELLPDYEFEYVQSTFDNILISLDAGKLDVGSHEFEYSDERAEKYLYGEEGYRDFSVYLISLKDSGYTTLESLAGKTVGDISSTDNSALLIQKYNEENPDLAINLDYYGDVDSSVVVESLIEGRWEAIVNLLPTYESYIEDYGDLFELGDAINTSEAYLLYPDDGEHEELQQAMDEAIRTIKESGQLDEFSQKWFNANAYPDEED